jgi:hypothetical protein
MRLQVRVTLTIIFSIRRQKTGLNSNLTITSFFFHPQASTSDLLAMSFASRMDSSDGFMKAQKSFLFSTPVEECSDSLPQGWALICLGKNPGCEQEV